MTCLRALYNRRRMSRVFLQVTSMYCQTLSLRVPSTKYYLSLLEPSISWSFADCNRTCLSMLLIGPDLPTCTDFRGTYRFWPSITISRFHAGVYRFWKMPEFLGLSDFDLFCFRRYSRILSASCTYRQSRRCVAAINSPPYVMNQC